VLSGNKAKDQLTPNCLRKANLVDSVGTSIIDDKSTVCYSSGTYHGCSTVHRPSVLDDQAKVLGTQLKDVSEAGRNASRGNAQVRCLRAQRCLRHCQCHHTLVANVLGGVGSCMATSVVHAPPAQ
jgi:hypothetical protein